MSAEVQTSGKAIDNLVEHVVVANILSSDYFKDLYRLKTYHEVVDEIYNHVDHVEPWMSGNCRGPSTAFCLLYKFFTMKLTVKQMQGLLHHTDSPYIRAIGFLYLRYVGDPKTLWQWFEPYIQDDEEFSPGTNGRMTKMGVYVRDLLLHQYYFDTIFPRIPVPVVRQITSHLERLKLPTTPQGTTGRHSSDETARRPPSVKAALSVSFGQRAPHRASTRDSSPVRRNLPPANGNSDDRSRAQDRSRDDRRDRDLDRDRPRSRESDYRDRGRDRRERSRDYERERDRHSSRDRERDRDRDYRRERERRSPDRDRYNKRYNNGRSRSRSASPKRRSDSPKDKTTNAAISANLLKLRDVYGDASGKKQEENHAPRVKDSSGEDVIRLGGSSWR